MKVLIQFREKQPISVSFKCPGCGEIHDLPVRGPGIERPSWEFNGSADKPTLKPSIKATIGPITDPEHRVSSKGWNAQGIKICHSFVTDGRIQFLGDCTHELANQTIELPEYP